jgi:integrase
VHDPAASLAGESVATKADQRKAAHNRKLRLPFSDENLKRVFNTHWYVTGRGAKTKEGKYFEFCPAHYWAPLIAALSGARLNEVCQLHLNDIRQTSSGAWYLSFNADTSDKKLKGDRLKDGLLVKGPSHRETPLHGLLFNLGLVKWRDALKHNHYERLFPELSHSGDKGYGKDMGEWFGAHLKRLDIPRDGTQVFHSFRHGFANAQPIDMPDRMRRQMTGHERGTDVHDKPIARTCGRRLLLPFSASWISCCQRLHRSTWARG